MEDLNAHFAEINWEDKENQNEFLKVIPYLNCPSGEIYLGRFLQFVGRCSFYSSKDNLITFCEQIAQSKPNCVFLPHVRTPQLFFNLDLIFSIKQKYEQIMEELS